MNVASNLALALACTAALVATAIASPPQHKGSQAGSHAVGAVTQAPYAGQETRAITSLSAEDVDALLAGRGWGLAKPAEFNGYPGPMHVLELAGELNLAPSQQQAVQASFERMKATAMDVGARYVAAERAIDDAFRAGVAQSVLADRIAAAERLRAGLRIAHLQAHLEITPLLTPKQRHRYAELRGYTGFQHDRGQHKH